MKLLELLVTERVKWPADIEKVCQGHDLQIEGIDEDGDSFSTDLYLKTLSENYRERSKSADECHADIVTKEQYDNACKLVDDGYTLWFGGECPVPYDTVVDLAFDDNADIDSARPAFHYDWKNQSAPNIIAYKVVVSSDEELLVVYEPDVVNHPSHYTNGKVECIDAIESATVGKTGIEAVCVANVIKYLWRYEDKNGLEDIKKAQWYLNKLIEVKK